MSQESVWKIQKSDTEEINLQIKEFKGKQYVDVRIYYQPEDSNRMVPTKKGVTFSASQLQSFVQGLRHLTDCLAKAEEHAAIHTNKGT